MTPIVTIMIGRLDDWMKVLVERDDLAVHPDAPELGRASPPSSAPTGSSASAATGRGCSPRRTATASTGRSSSAATSA